MYLYAPILQAEKMQLYQLCTIIRPPLGASIIFQPIETIQNATTTFQMTMVA
jgi:hypothetical protein